ncbi:MAG: hypothetical protein FWG75_06415 [Cystobacterineae bacterium]|nr:hypothetical protein [Cystobacterineae bacterium]
MKNFCFFILMITGCFLLSCSSASEYNYLGKSEGFFDATFTEQTVHFESTDDLISMDEDGYVYTFKNTSDKAKKLKKDSILLMNGELYIQGEPQGGLLRKVLEVREEGNAIVVETSDATLDELIEDGSIEWTTYVDFSPENFNFASLHSRNQIRVQLGDKLYPATSQKGNKVNFEFETETYKYELTMKMEKTSAYITLEVSKKVNGEIKGKFMAEGRISAFDSSNKIEYNNSQIKEFSNQNKNLKGEFTLSLTVAASNRDSVTMELPFVIMEIPKMIGPIPVFLRLKLLVLLNSLVPYDGSSQTSINFKYDSETGIKYDGKTVDVQGNKGKYSITKNKSEVGASSHIAVNYGIGFPRVELGVFHDILVPWIQTSFLIGSDFTPAFPVCKQTRASYMASFGYDLGFLGIKLSGAQGLWREEKILEQIGDCPDP